jgi:hypothetical protein
METKPVHAKPILSARLWLSAFLTFLVTGLARAGDAVNTITATDSLAKDSVNTAKTGAGMSGIEDNPWLKYTVMGLGILVVVAFALFTSLRKSKPAPSGPVGYRKPNQHRHHHKVKL